MTAADYCLCNAGVSTHFGFVIHTEQDKCVSAPWWIKRITTTLRINYLEQMEISVQYYTTVCVCVCVHSPS